MKGRELLNVERINVDSSNHEKLMSFNENFSTGFGTPMKEAWIVDCFEDKNKIALLFAVPMGYIYVQLTNDLGDVDKSLLIFPPAGVGHGSWKVLKATRVPTNFGLHIPSGSQNDVIERVEL